MGSQTKSDCIALIHCRILRFLLLQRKTFFSLYFYCKNFICSIISLVFSPIFCPLVWSLLLKGDSTLKTEFFWRQNTSGILKYFTPCCELSPLLYSLYHHIAKNTHWVQRKLYDVDEEKQHAAGSANQADTPATPISLFFLFLRFQWKLFHPVKRTHKKWNSLQK